MPKHKKYHVTLSDHERETLGNFVSDGKKSAREINRARILLLLNKGKKDEEISELLGISRQTVFSVNKKFNEGGYESILDSVREQPRSGRPVEIDTRTEADITMIACSQPPEGHAKWTLRLIADRVVKLETEESISHESVRKVLKKNRLKPWLSEQWCIGRITGDYIWHMEDVLHQYEMPYDPLHPLICFDERPCFLIGDTDGIIPMSPGKARRYNYEYEKNGSCVLFLAFDPHTGFRHTEVRDRRTAVDYAQFMQNLINFHYPDAERIRLVQDNLNTHTPGSFYEVLAPQKAFELSQKFEPHYTPKKGSWLNMAEIEFSAVSKQCLDRRLPDIETLRREVLAWADERNSRHKTADWKFSKNNARIKLERHYSNVKKLI